LIHARTGKLILSYEDYLRMPDDGLRREILGGDLYVTPAPTPKHQRTVVNLLRAIDDHVTKRGLGKVFVSPIDVVLSDLDVVQPDIVLVAKDRMNIVTENAIQGFPDLLVEVSSPSTLDVDTGRKMETYARFGVPEYWVADPKSQAVYIYALEEGAYKLHDHSERAGTVRSRRLPDLEVRVDDLWE
jgi:Uma2 family endonuclease